MLGWLNERIRQLAYKLEHFNCTRATRIALEAELKILVEMRTRLLVANQDGY